MTVSKGHNEDDGHVFRDKIEEFRNPYYVSYYPAQRGSPLAMLSVVYPEGAQPAVAEAKRAVQDELKYWWGRYNVPTMASAWAGDDPIELGESFNHLVGYMKHGAFLQEWRAVPDAELKYQTPEELAEIYRDVPFRIPAKVREAVRREWVARARAVRGFVFLLVVFPVLIEMTALWINWLGHVLAAISICAGLLKLGRTMGWVKPSAKEVADAKEEQEMKHHHYHCKRNPTAFLALKSENFKKELDQREQAEFERIRATGLRPRDS